MQEKLGVGFDKYKLEEAPDGRRVISYRTGNELGEAFGLIWMLIGIVLILVVFFQTYPRFGLIASSVASLVVFVVCAWLADKMFYTTYKIVIHPGEGIKFGRKELPYESVESWEVVSRATRNVVTKTRGQQAKVMANVRGQHICVVNEVEAPMAESILRVIRKFENP